MVIALAFGLLTRQAIQVFPIETESDRIPKVHTGGTCLIRHGRVFTVTGPVLENTDVMISSGKIVAIGQNLTATPEVTVIDATGKCVLPGIVDAHSHRGEAESNEWSASAVPEVRITDVLVSTQKGLWDDLANGITTGMLLHGSSDAIGGQSVVVKHRYNRPSEEMIFKGAPRMVKFALGENVSSKLDEKGTRYPQSRAGVESVYRRAFTDARAYMLACDDYSKGKTTEQPRRDLRLEALADILKGKIWVQCHSYRQDEILMMVRLSQEFGFKIGAMQHALEAYKIAPELAKAHVPASMFSDAWDYKEEVYDAIPMGVSLCVRAGVLTSVNTDTFSGLAPLNVDAAKTMRYGISDAEALKLITINPAKQLGVDQYVGSLELGKDGDISIWSGNPLSIFSRCAETLIDGEVVFQRRDAFGTDLTSTTEDGVRPNKLDQDLLSLPGTGHLFAITGGEVHTISRGVIHDGVVLVRDGVIEGVGASGEVAIPKNAKLVDAKGLSVYPGLIDGGSDIGLVEVGSVRSLHDDDENGPIQPDLNFLTSINPETVKIPIARCAGVTTVAVRPTGHGLIVGQSAVVSLEGSTREQMADIAQQGLEVFYPEPVPASLADVVPKAEVDKRNGAVQANRDAIKDFFALATRYVALREAGTIEPDSKLEAMRPYLDGSKPVVVHANAEEAIRDALNWAVHLPIKVIIAGGAEAWKVTDLLKSQGVPVIYHAPTVSCPGQIDPTGDFAPYDSALSAPFLFEKAGVKYCLSVGDSANINNLPWSAGILVAHGLTKDQALRSITLGAAEVLGCSKSLGSLDVGKTANIIVTDGNPLEVTTQVKMEFIHGQSMELKSKFNDLYRKYEKRLSGG